MNYIYRLIINMVAFVGLSMLFPHMIHVDGMWTALLASFILSILNVILRPILSVFAFPLTILTLGFFNFVLNAAMLQMTAALLGEMKFSFSSFGASIIIAIILSLVNTIVNEYQLGQMN